MSPNTRQGSVQSKHLARPPTTDDPDAGKVIKVQHTAITATPIVSKHQRAQAWITNVDLQHRELQHIKD